MLKEYNLYKSKKGSPISKHNFSFEDDEREENLIHFICQSEAEHYEIVCKEGTDITVEVSDYDSIYDIWMVLYSYYYSEKRFVKHE